MAMQIDFGEYVVQHKSGYVSGERGGDHYAFSGDLKLLKAMRQLKPVELAVSSLVRLGKGVMSGELLGTAVKVGPNQFPRVYKMVRECSETLGINVPTVYVQGNISSVNAFTYGTDKEAVIVIHSVAIDYFTDAELKFVIGHECGHVQNGHVVYLTALETVRRMAEAFLGVLMQPALIAMRGWSRAAEITCDRAGLICCGDLTVAQHSFLKMVVGSKKLYEEMNVEAYLDQLREGRDGMGRAAELNKTHPYIPKRIEALRLFALSDVYHRTSGGSGGVALSEIDRQVEELVKVL